MPKKKQNEDFHLEELTQEEEAEILKKPKQRRTRSSKKNALATAVQEAEQLLLFEKIPGKISSVKDDIASMEFSFYSVSTKVDNLPYEFNNGHQIIRIVPSVIGRPNQQFDKDLMLYINSLLARAQFEHEDDHLKYRRIEINLADFCRFTHREFDGTMSEAFMNSLLRLRGTTIQTTVRSTAEDELINGFSLIESYKVLKRSSGKREGVLSAEVTISKWQARQVHDKYVLTIDDDYFSIKRPTERRIYEIARKFCGNQKILFRISLSNLLMRMGLSASKTLRAFRYQIKQIVLRNEIPKYNLAYDAQNDHLIIFPRDLKVREFLRSAAENVQSNSLMTNKSFEELENWFKSLVIHPDADPYAVHKYLAGTKK